MNVDQINLSNMVDELKKYVVENLSLSALSDEELYFKIEEISFNYMNGKYVSIEERVAVVEQVYSSIRGFGILDSILSDDSITEVMINGKDNVFIE